MPGFELHQLTKEGLGVVWPFVLLLVRTESVKPLQEKGKRDKGFWSHEYVVRSSDKPCTSGVRKGGHPLLN